MLWYYAGVAQLAELLPSKQVVVGSSPIARSGSLLLEGEAHLLFLPIVPLLDSLLILRLRFLSGRISTVCYTKTGIGVSCKRLSEATDEETNSSRR